MWGCPSRGRKTSTHPTAELRHVQNKTAAAAQGLQSPTLQHNLEAGSLEKERDVGGLFPEIILLPAGL